ncbi:hypothetical protein BLNAU_7929 [Blattamonas nauphoetae]|uniref:RRM domain-containing protein n=1 Tax=Blattamonas nauphoetae TaxID=2049346 RepID=A0ABQ9Y088_9EUKA|nr:hypothetical protein BLNAU_7929 [Blattamonas nauphoetae]
MSELSIEWSLNNPSGNSPSPNQPPGYTPGIGNTSQPKPPNTISSPPASIFSTPPPPRELPSEDSNYLLDSPYIPRPVVRFSRSTINPNYKPPPPTFPVSKSSSPLTLATLSKAAKQLHGPFQSPHPAVSHTTIAVMNLPKQTREDLLYSRFSKYGKIKFIRRGISHTSPRFIEYYHVEDAERAQISENKTLVLGQVIEVGFSDSPQATTVYSSSFPQTPPTSSRPSGPASLTFLEPQPISLRRAPHPVFFTPLSSCSILSHKSPQMSVFPPFPLLLTGVSQFIFSSGPFASLLAEEDLNIPRARVRLD